MSTVRLMRDIFSGNKKQLGRKGEEAEVIKGGDGKILFVQVRGEKFCVLREETDADNPGQSLAEELPPPPPPPGTGRTKLYSQRGKKK